MAIKVALAAALLVALVAAASATTYTTTTITTTSYDEEGGRRYQQCRQQVQGRQFRACQSYLQQRSSPYDEVVVEGEANPQRETVEECCQQLRQMDRNQCGCEAIKHAMRQAQQGGSHRSYQTGSQSEQMFQKARQLPRMCGLREQQCRFNVVLV